VSDEVVAQQRAEAAALLRRQQAMQAAQAGADVAKTASEAKTSDGESMLDIAQEATGQRTG